VGAVTWDLSVQEAWETLDEEIEIRSNIPEKQFLNAIVQLLVFCDHNNIYSKRILSNSKNMKPLS
jgi:hypothetical protein